MGVGAQVSWVLKGPSASCLPKGPSTMMSGANAAQAAASSVSLYTRALPPPSFAGSPTAAVTTAVAKPKFSTS